ncbi:MAG: peptidoglycan editing factor PgeF [Lachnospiraceae bacterium]|nr:peptidoglycan editing factor PgeF [Lachnospiraceae bacterium]
MTIKWKTDENSRRTHVHKTGAVSWLTFAPLEKEEAWLEHYFSTREGGVSEGWLSSMNLSFTQEPDEQGEKNVRENFCRFAEGCGFSMDDVVMSDQTHTTNVVHVTDADKGRGWSRDKDWKDVDGFITDTPGVILSTFYADCVPLFFADPVHKAIGLSHSGWKGTVGQIGRITLEKMNAAFGTQPEDVIVVIGPSICVDCYEVSEDVAGHFPAECLIAKGGGKYQLDLWKANELILLKAGIRQEHLMTPDICTACNMDFLYSHRASGGRRGNLGAFLGIRKD